VRPLTASGRLTGRLVVAIDGLDAGPGDRVIVAHGTRVRDITVGEAVADKDVVVGIVDGMALDAPAASGGTVGAKRGPARSAR
jgi:microcompartment protein CcmK/EutM